MPDGDHLPPLTEPGSDDRLLLGLMLLLARIFAAVRPRTD